MAWEARSGLKHDLGGLRGIPEEERLNGLGSPFGIETTSYLK